MMWVPIRVSKSSMVFRDIPEPKSNDFQGIPRLAGDVNMTCQATPKSLLPLSKRRVILLVRLKEPVRKVPAGILSSEKTKTKYDLVI